MRRRNSPCAIAAFNAFRYLFPLTSMSQQMPPREASSSVAPAPTPAPNHSGYPLSALFVVVTVCAILAAMLSPLARGQFDGTMLAGSTIGLGLLGLLAGFVVGATYPSRLTFIPLGSLSGLLLGLCLGPLVVLPVHSLATIFAACVGGAVAIVGVAVIVRLAERKRNLSPISATAETPPSPDPQLPR